MTYTPEELRKEAYSLACKTDDGEYLDNVFVGDAIAMIRYAAELAERQEKALKVLEQLCPTSAGAAHVAAILRGAR